MMSSNSRLPSTATTFGSADGGGEPAGDGVAVGDGETPGDSVCALVSCVVRNRINSGRKISRLGGFRIGTFDWPSAIDCDGLTRVRSLSKLGSCVNDFLVLDKNLARQVTFRVQA